MILIKNDPPCFLQQVDEAQPDFFGKAQSQWHAEESFFMKK